MYNYPFANGSQSTESFSLVLYQTTDISHTLKPSHVRLIKYFAYFASSTSEIFLSIVQMLYLNIIHYTLDLSISSYISYSHPSSDQWYLRSSLVVSK